jgi:hypothetical protein
MATVTPNFNWPVPTSTDLVKDGATAIEALGDSIDGSLVDLKGGTTGQVLSKTSATDMDFTWVTSDDANAIQNSIVDAKGDLISATANDTPARLAVGANGETLVADSSATTGLRWQAPAAENPILNSAFQVWQRGTSVTVPTTALTYTADRWNAYRAATNTTVTRQTTSDTTNLPNIQYCARIQRTAADTSTQAIYFSQSFETINSIPFAGKTVSYSFYARAGANYSPTSSALSLNITAGTGTDQNWISTTGATYPINTSATLTTTWQRFTYTGTIATTATELSLVFSMTPTGTAGAADYFEITGVQLEVGSVATQFKTYAATIQGELAACQRYYQRVLASSTFTRWAVAYVTSTTAANAPFTFPVTMRVAPSAIDTTGTAANYQLTNATGSGLALNAVPAINDSSTTHINIYCTVASGLVAGNATGFMSTTASAYVGWSAEL